jgi:hypothetical protein
MSKIKFTFFVFFFISCQESFDSNQVKNDYPKSNPLPVNVTGSSKGRILTSFLNWESSETFSFKNPNNQIVTILPPWASGVSVVIPDAIRFDYKKIDGWELLYHTFDPTNLPNIYHPQLVLYNKYRGIMRFFYFNIQDPSMGSNYLASAITFDSAPTSHLNFTDEFCKIGSEKKTFPFFIQSNIAKLNQGLAVGTWYSFDYELSYDENVKNISEDQLTMRFKTWAVQESLLDLNGTIIGTLDGHMQTSGSGLSIFNNLINNLSYKNTSVSNSITATTGEAVNNSLKDKITLGINSSLANSISSELGKLASQGINFAASPLSNLFNKVVTSNLNSKQAIHLDLSAKVAMKGTLKYEALVYDLTFLLPGTKRDKNIPGYAPYYDKTLGVFYVDKAPKVTATSRTTSEGGSRNTLVTRTTFTLDPASFNLVFNPEVSSEFTVTNISKQIIWFKKYKGRIPYTGITGSGTLVNITADNEWYLAGTRLSVSRNGSGAWADIGVRISFTLVPNNGSSPVYFVKTFRPVIIDNSTF